MIDPKPLARPELVPGAAAIARCVREVVETVLAPALGGASERSAVATIRPTLRYVEQLIEHQGQALLDEEHELAGLLADAADWLDDKAGGTATAAAIRATLAEAYDPRVYPSLALMGDRIARRREHVCALLAALHARAADDAAGTALHERVRAYIAWQIDREGRLVEPAFLGQGPRR